MMSLELGILTPHSPRICHEEMVADFQREMVDGMKVVGKQITDMKPDAIVLVSCHWQSSFIHFVDATPVHRGVLTAFECPELISDVPYEHPGDPVLAHQFVVEGEKAGLKVYEVNDPTYVWDYGTVVPLRYLVPNGDIPIIDLSITWAANIEETYIWGQQIGKVIRESDKRIIFASSGALAHNLVRGPENMPTRSEQILDNQFVDYLKKGDYQSAYDMLPQYSKVAGVESGGRHLAMLLGVLGEEGFKGNYHGYGQSSGSGNVIMTFDMKNSHEEKNLDSIESV